MLDFDFNNKGNAASKHLIKQVPLAYGENNLATMEPEPRENVISKILNKFKINE